MSKLKFIDLFAGLGDIAKPQVPFFVTTHQNNVTIYILVTFVSTLSLQGIICSKLTPKSGRS